MIRVAMTAAPDASGHYRIRQPAAEVIKQFPDDFSIVIGNLREIEATSFDLLVLQRPMYAFMPTLIDAVRAMGKPVIVELDDDFHSVPVGNHAFLLNHPKANRIQNWNHLSACLRACDWVTCSTPQLAVRYGSDGRVSVLRNAVDDWWLQVPHVDTARAFGWTGMARSHAGDPQATMGAVNTVLADNPEWRFDIIGGKDDFDQLLGQFGIPSENRDRVGATPFADLSLLPYVMTSLDVGIVPLANTRYSEAKSWLKGIQFAALGIPFVASDLPEYRLLYAEYDLGRLATERHRSWRRELNSWLHMLDWRAEIGEVYRETVAKHLVISKHAWRWAEVWQSVVEKGVRRGRREARTAQGA